MITNGRIVWSKNVTLTLDQLSVFGNKHSVYWFWWGPKCTEDDWVGEGGEPLIQEHGSALYSCICTVKHCNVCFIQLSSNRQAVPFFSTNNQHCQRQQSSAARDPCIKRGDTHEDLRNRLLFSAMYLHLQKHFKWSIRWHI